jgi:hypothetical protein
MKLFLAMLFFSNIFFAQDTILNRSLIAGSKLKITNGKKWKIESVCITSNDGHNIKISNKYFKTTYYENDTLLAPYYIPEMELITNKSMICYFFKIIEEKNK